MATLNRTFSVKNGIDVANTIVIDSSRNLSNIATANATTVNAETFITTGGLNVTDQANNARDQANTARDQANSARNQANTGYGQANDAYSQANTARGQANTARDVANAAYAQANTSYLPSVTRLDVTNNGASAYRFDQYGAAVDDPTLYVRAGETIAFNLNNAGHPFVIRVSDGGANYDTGLTHVDASGTVTTGSAAQGKVSGTLYWKIPYSLQGNTYVYQCSVHAGMVGNIVIEPPMVVAYAQANAAYADANTRVLKAGDTMTGNLNVAATIISQNIVPNLNVTYDLGTATKRFKDLYLSNGTIYLGETALSSDADELRANTFNAATAFISGGLNVLGQANAARDQANTARDTANGAYGQANGAYGQANGAYAQANGAYAQANGAYAQANSGFGQANGAYAQANSAANTVRVSANSGSTLSNKQLNFINSQSIQVSVSDAGDGNANIVFNTTGAAVADAYAQANAGYAQANAARDQANSAYGEANLKLNISGGTITGSLVVQGNLEILGNSTTLNVETLAVEDNEIILNSNVTGGPALDAFITINRGSSTNAVLKWDEAADQWKWADGEGTFYAFDTALDAYASANLGYAQANTARGTANDAYAQANTARDTANDSYSQANTARTQANTARDQANTAYGQANDAYGQANTARGQANAAYAQANAAYADANTRVLKAGDTMTGVLTIANSGFGLSVGNAAVTYQLSVGSLNVTTNTVTTSATGQVVLDTFGTTEHSSAKYFVQVKSGTAYHTTEIVLVQDATNVWLTEYGSIQTGASLGTFSADINSGNARLLFNAENATNTIRSVRYGVAPP